MNKDKFKELATAKHRLDLGGSVESRSSVRDRIRREGVDSKLGGVDRFPTVADVIDHFLGEWQPSAVEIKSER